MPQPTNPYTNKSHRHCYRPQRSWAKVIFLQVPVCDAVNRGGSASVHAVIPPNPPGTRPPPCTKPPPPGAAPPPPGADTPIPSPRDQTPPPRIRSTSGPYASYWNASLFGKLVPFPFILPHGNFPLHFL